VGGGQGRILSPPQRRGEEQGLPAAPTATPTGVTPTHPRGEHAGTPPPGPGTPEMSPPVPAGDACHEGIPGAALGWGSPPRGLGRAGATGETGMEGQRLGRGPDARTALHVRSRRTFISRYRIWSGTGGIRMRPLALPGFLRAPGSG